MHHRPTAAYIDLDALSFNLISTRSFVGKHLKYMAVVKADAYGHGAVECAKRLEANGVDWFGVAIPEEGVELRNAGIIAPILCLGSFWPGQEEMLIGNRLTTVIYDLEMADSLSRYAAVKNSPVDIHVKVDTGMGRVGVKYTDCEDFAAGLKRFSNLTVTGLMTHFAAAEDSSQDEFTELQINRFNETVRVFQKHGHEAQIVDLANSPGAIRHSNSHGNLVRLGGALFGLLADILPSELDAPELKPVLSLRSRIAHIKHVGVGERLGYGRTFTTNRDSLIALVPIGYADGFHRGLSNRTHAIVDQMLVPVVGRISMDWTLLDITDVPNPNANDEVILIGSDGPLEIKAADLAAHLGTIGYEVTCGISSRVPRNFTQ